MGTELEKAKYKLCKTISCYKRTNNLSEKQLAEKLTITPAKVEKILFCHVKKLTFEELVNHLKNLDMPWERKINSKYEKSKEISPKTY